MTKPAFLLATLTLLTACAGVSTGVRSPCYKSGAEVTRAMSFMGPAPLITDAATTGTPDCDYKSF